MLAAVDQDVDNRRRCGRGEQHLINDVKHAILSNDVSNSHLGVIDKNPILIDANDDFCALNGFNELPIRQIHRKNLFDENVMGEYFIKRLEGKQVFEGDLQRFQQGDESGICWCHNRQCGCNNNFQTPLWTESKASNKV